MGQPHALGQNLHAANRLIQAAEADQNAFLAEHGRGVIDELRAEAEDIPARWMLGQIAEPAARYDQLSGEPATRSAPRGRPRPSDPAEPITAPLGTLKGTHRRSCHRCRTSHNR